MRAASTVQVAKALTATSTPLSKNQHASSGPTDAFSSQQGRHAQCLSVLKLFRVPAIAEAFILSSFKSSGPALLVNSHRYFGRAHCLHIRCPRDQRTKWHGIMPPHTRLNLHHTNSSFRIHDSFSRVVIRPSPSPISSLPRDGSPGYNSSLLLSFSLTNKFESWENTYLHN